MQNETGRRKMEIRRVKKILLFTLLSMTGAVSAQLAPTADFYVSTCGSDSWSGRLATPNARESDGPFATLTRARDAVRDLKKQKTTEIVVWVRGGTYELKKRVVFGLEDSGVGDSTVTYAAYPGETPMFSSGREIKGIPMMGRNEKIKWNRSAEGLTIYLPKILPDLPVIGFRISREAATAGVNL
jgi:hypothetical protein